MAYEEIKSFITTKGNQYFRLSGYAGTGKSYLVGSIILWLSSQIVGLSAYHEKVKYTLASPTNKAARNLQSICQSQGIEVEVTTVAKLLGIKPEINEQSGKQEFNATADGNISDYDLVFIDEFSMLSKKIVEDIWAQTTYTMTKVIFIGDDAQLPPVGESISAIVNHPDIKDFAVLKEVVRYEGEIAKVAEEIRANPIYNTADYPFKTSEDGTVFKLSESDWLTTALGLLKEDIHSARIIAWRNKTVDSYNRQVRNYLYGAVEDYIIGDILIAKSPVFRKIKSKPSIIFNTSEEFTVISEKILKTVQFLNEDWHYWEVPVGGEFPLIILLPEYEKKREAILETIKAKALKETDKDKRGKIWRNQFYPLNEAFDSISYAYSTTCHKAQGSSIPHVFLDTLDMRMSSDKQKILYTGLTRAKQAVYVMM